MMMKKLSIFILVLSAVIFSAPANAIFVTGGPVTTTNATTSVVGGGAEATAQRVTIANDSTGVVSVDDNSSSLTVDNATISVVGSGVEATAQRVTIATDSTGVLSVDDNGASLTVDGTALTVTQKGVEWETVAASQTDQICGATGAAGDYIRSLVITIVTVATATVDLQDADGTAFNIITGNAALVPGVVVVELGLTSLGATTPGWKVTTGAGATAICVGDFT